MVHAAASSSPPGVAPAWRGPEGDLTSTRIIEGALRCFARFGVSKTTFDDIAREAGCSRATVYRYFGGKQALLAAVAEAEIRRVARALDPLAADAETLDELVVTILTHAGREFASHEALGHLLAVEPEVVLPHVVFDGAERLFGVVSAILAPHLGRFLPAEDVPRAGEWLCRLTVTYLFSPSHHLSLTDEASVRRFVETFVMPGLSTYARELCETHQP